MEKYQPSQVPNVWKNSYHKKRWKTPPKKSYIEASYLSILPQYLPSAVPPGYPDGTGDGEAIQHMRQVTR